MWPSTHIHSPRKRSTKTPAETVRFENLVGFFISGIASSNYTARIIVRLHVFIFFFFLYKGWFTGSERREDSLLSCEGSPDLTDPVSLKVDLLPDWRRDGAPFYLFIYSFFFCTKHNCNSPFAGTGAASGRAAKERNSQKVSEPQPGLHG